MRLKPERLAARRTALGLSQEELGSIVGISQKQISKYENGDSDAKGENLAALARSLGTTTDWLLGLTDNPNVPLRDVTDLAEDERQLLELYRSTPRDRRRQALELLRVNAG